MQDAIQQMYEILDVWGDGLTRRSASRLATAPIEQRIALRDSLWEAHYRSWAVPVNELHLGQLRPLVIPPSGTNDAAGVKTLLYARQAVIDNGLIDLPSQSDAWREPAALETALHRLVDIRPLLDDGSLFVTPIIHSGDLSENDAIEEDESRELLIAQLTPKLGPRAMEAVWNLWRGLWMVSHHLVSPLALSREQLAVYSAIAEMGVDSRVTKLVTLARVSVPDLLSGDQSLNLMVKVRQDEAAFAQWRSVLDHALMQVASIPESESALASAEATIQDCVKEATDHLESELKKSPFLSTAFGGVRELGFIATGAAASAATLTALGAPIQGAAAGAASTAVISGLKILSSTWQQHRRTETLSAVRNLGMTFFPETK